MKPFKSVDSEVCKQVSAKLSAEFKAQVEQASKALGECIHIDPPVVRGDVCQFVHDAIPVFNTGTEVQIRKEFSDQFVNHRTYVYVSGIKLVSFFSQHRDGLYLVGPEQRYDPETDTTVVSIRTGGARSYAYIFAGEWKQHADVYSNGEYELVFDHSFDFWRRYPKDSLYSGSYYIPKSDDTNDYMPRVLLAKPLPGLIGFRGDKRVYYAPKEQTLTMLVNKVIV